MAGRKGVCWKLTFSISCPITLERYILVGLFAAYFFFVIGSQTSHL